MTWSLSGVQKGEAGKFIVKDAEFVVMDIPTKVSAYYKTEGTIYVEVFSSLTKLIGGTGLLISLLGTSNPRFYILDQYKEYLSEDKVIHAGRTRHFNEVLDKLREVCPDFADAWRSSLVRDHFRGPKNE